MKAEILKHLKKHANISRQELAERLNSDVATVEALIDELENDQEILGYQAILNQNGELEKEVVRAIIEVRVSPRREGGYDSIARRIARFPEVSDVYLMSGGYDLSVQLNGDNLQEIARVVSQKLSTIDGILSCATHFILKKYKESGFLYDQEDEYERLKIAP